ncbi:HlyD family type I secretion periplasmic adaptor subunit [Pseudomaricurvus sp. HS19]|uniref:HlyD family type I secretion periplasmic adaptor subunit n=1 Tax=Pseudomaricurvus sp. HS19 TaxID=2692626 RepID=UPI00136EC162|nr:HlyD family type I secretion periplasmic adaptor subunit [Pseudomaricurvus sp. HS19]MYM64758.1 HlyD family type I secretion periplasmic adaptor subunit [Pseudomaricurvus sp. HS19]
MKKQLILRAFPDSSQDKAISRTLIGVAAFVGLLGIWATFAKVPEVSKTRGEVLPQGGDIHVIQSLSGGKILQVYVTEGDVVVKGQDIARLDQSVSEADIRKLDVKYNDILMQMERLRALEQERTPDFGAEGKSFPGIAKVQLELFESQSELKSAKLKEIDDEAVSKQAELDSAGKQLGFIDEQVQIIYREEQMLETAVDKGLIPKRQLLEKQEAVSALKKEREEVVGRQETLQKEMLTLQTQRRSMEQDLRTEYRTNRAELVEQLREVEEELAQAHSALGQNALQAPEDGIIKSLPNAKVGAVIQPGGVVAELVPSNQPLNVEVRVSPRDIGFIAVGQQVLIKIDAYDYSRFGAIQGEVERVSPATFKDERTGEPYFKAHIQPVSEYVGDEARDRRIKVGMTVEADITTGHKTILQYLLKPVYTTVDTALTER